jgi:hypothetical protein
VRHRWERRGGAGGGGAGRGGVRSVRRGRVWDGTRGVGASGGTVGPAGDRRCGGGRRHGVKTREVKRCNCLTFILFSSKKIR